MPYSARQDVSRSSNPRTGRPMCGKRRRSRHRFETPGTTGDNRSSHVAELAAVHPHPIPEHESTPVTGTGNAILRYAEQEPRADLRRRETGLDNYFEITTDVTDRVCTPPPTDRDRVAISSTSINSTPILLNWKSIWGLIMTNGSLKMTKEQYQCMRLVADTFSRLSCGDCSDERASVPVQCARIDCLPHYTTLFKTYKPLVLNSLAVRGHLWYSDLNIRSAGARPTRFTEQGAPQIPILTVVPSEYAREDVACGPVFDLMRSTSLARNEIERPTLAATDCVDCWPLVAARDWFYGPCSSFSVDAVLPSLDTPFFAESGDTIQITVLGTNDVENALPFFLEATSTTLKGKVLHVWTVHHQSRCQDPEFLPTYPESISVLDRNIIKQFSFASYTSPSDSVQIPIPEVPVEDQTDDRDDISHTNRSSRTRECTAMADAVRQRRAALLERRRCMDDAWRCWKKPLLKPGDTVALLEPVNSSPYPDFERTAGHSITKRLCLVHRFWVEQEERGRHVFLVAQDTSALECASPMPFRSRDDCFHRDVRQVLLESTADSVRGPYRAKPVSSIGTLDSGESYFIYRFILYWDGFELASGKAASGDGIYLIPLNLPTVARSSPHAVRVISLTPPGVKAETVFKVITDDIVKGMTTGFQDYDADGNQIRIFLDLVAFIGDTPAINAVLDVLGHTGSACCHLCRLVRRSDTTVGSRYTSEGYHSFATPALRGYYQHRALRDSGAKSETLRILGLKPTDVGKYYPLHELRMRMLAAQDSIPTTMRGRPLISGQLDPYRACLVAPDHLLTGHFRDCMNCAFGLLPTPDHRKITEKFIIGLLHDCNLSVQNRIYDHGKRGLFSMSMTELYSLTVVAEFGFIKGCAFANESNNATPDIPAKCFDAIRLLGSCARLIAELWHVPESELGSSTVSSGTGLKRLHSLQILVQSHISSVKRLCHMEEAKVHMLQNARTNRQTKADLSKEYRSCQLAIKALDKPNLHRLQELVYGTLPMVGNICRIGELQLEKKHQLLKRAVRQSNKKNAHLQSVQSAIFTDWQGRLTVQVPGALQRNPKSEFGCYRLLAGRDEIDRLKGTLSDTDRQQMHDTLGPESFVPAILSSQNMVVISPRAQATSLLTWTLGSRKESVTSSTESISSPARRNAFEQFNAVCNLIDLTADVEFAESIVCTTNGFRILTLKCGDLIEAHCAYHTDLNRHYPIVHQYFGPKRPGSRYFHTIPLLWGVSCIFSFNGEYWAAVFLCRVLSDVPRPSETMCPSKKYLMDNKIAFLRLHPGIRPTGVLRDCIPGTCVLSNANLTITHSISCSPFNSASFYVKKSSDGFPPRRG